jgi:glycogen debranching enzyme
MPDEAGRGLDEYSILSASAAVDDRTRVLKHGDTFAIFNRFGDIEGVGASDLGLYHNDTRFLSRLSLRLEDMRPLLLSSTVKDDNLVFTVDLTNPDIWRDGEVAIPHGTLHFFRSKLLWQATCHERLRIHNFGAAPVEFSLSLGIDADFTDMFEVRGVSRARRGRRKPSRKSADELLLAYDGLDGRTRRTRLTFMPAPSALDEMTGATYRIRLEPGAEVSYQWAVGYELDAEPSPSNRPRDASRRYEEAARQAELELDAARADDPEIYTSNEQFNELLSRSLADLHMMRTDTAHGPYPYAGVPWFCTAFGRDGIITALECLWFNPAVARGVLGYLAQTQADHEDAEQDAQPGKILHETRAGEMAALNEVPFGRYYGTVDATPLFVMLAGAYYERSGDLDFARSLWPHVMRALGWIETYGDSDGDGLVEYARHSPHGLLHQGWKDSHDSVFHADGAPAEPPVALCEVQAYVYGAKQAAARLAIALGHTEQAGQLEAEARSLRRRFDEAFWCDELGTYAIALDRHKQPCRVRASNAGHCLYTGIAESRHAQRAVTELTSEASFSGWGIRTVAAGEARFNPMSYHNGSIWPHDNALIAAGFARYGRKQEAARVLGGLFDASMSFDLHRLPELFCGFRRRPGESPTLYPVSCAPQSWASAAVFLLVQSCLGLRVSGEERNVTFGEPLLPEFLQWVNIRGLRVGQARVDLMLQRHASDVGVNVLRREGDVRVVVSK